MSFTDEREWAFCQLRLFSMLVHHGNNRHAGLGFVALGASADPTPSAGIGAC
jgi:hypothetical protein